VIRARKSFKDTDGDFSVKNLRKMAERFDWTSETIEFVLYRVSARYYRAIFEKKEEHPPETEVTNGRRRDRHRRGLEGLRVGDVACWLRKAVDGKKLKRAGSGEPGLVPVRGWSRCGFIEIARRRYAVMARTEKRFPWVRVVVEYRSGVASTRAGISADIYRVSQIAR